MRHRSGSVGTVFGTLLLSFLFLLPGCVGEGGTTEEPTEADPAPAQVAFEIPDTEAGRTLAAVLAEAGESDRLVFLHTGADW